MKENETKIPLWRRTSIIFIACLFFPIGGIILLWASKKPRTPLFRIILTLFLIFYTALLFSPENKDESKKENDTNLKVEETQKGQGQKESEIVTQCVHEYGKWKTTAKATCTEVGIKERKCKKCKSSETKEIKAKGHKWSKWKVSKTATISEGGEKERTCKNCKEKENEEYELTNEEKREYLYNNCVQYSFDEIARFPKNYKGKCAKYTGEVLQVADKRQIRVDITRITNEYIGDYYEDTIYVELDDSVNLDWNILEGDIVTFYGVMNGEYSYTSVLGSEVSLPYMIAYDVSFVGKKE